LNSKGDSSSQYIESNDSLFEATQEAVVLPVYEGEKTDLLEQINQTTHGLFDELKESEEFTGKKGESTTIFSPSGFKTKRLIFVGLGEKNHVDPRSYRFNLEVVLRKLRRILSRGVAVYCGPEITFQKITSQECTVESAIAAGYEPGHYKTDKKISSGSNLLVLLVPKADSSQTPISRSVILGEANCLARRLAFEPGNKLNPTEFSLQASSIAEDSGLKCEILEHHQLKSLGMDALIGVAEGSKQPAKLLVLRHQSDDNRPPLLLVGKGVTFDAGGISLKPSQSMEEMKGDKSGAAAVLGAMTAVSGLKVRRNVIGVIPLVENLPGGSAQRPGDVVRSYSGKTIEVINTDAEGRLILADTISWAREKFNPGYIVDIATLTGACVVALGNVRAGYFSNQETLAKLIEAAALRSGEKVWRLPLDSEYREDLLSEIADIKNIGGRWGGAVTAAKFIEEFVEETPWCHIDMAGLDFFPKGKDLVGATGFGAMLLTCLAEELGT